MVALAHGDASLVADADKVVGLSPLASVAAFASLPSSGSDVSPSAPWSSDVTVSFPISQLPYSLEMVGGEQSKGGLALKLLPAGKKAGRKSKKNVTASKKVEHGERKVGDTSERDSTVPGGTSDVSSESESERGQRKQQSKRSVWKKAGKKGKSSK